MVRGPGPTQPHRRCEAGREGRFGGRGIAAGAAALRIHTHTRAGRGRTENRGEQRQESFRTEHCCRTPRTLHEKRSMF